MIINIDVSQLIQGGVSAVFNGICVLLSGRFVLKAIDNIERKNDRHNGDKGKGGGDGNK
jgi:hypothetical protein